MKSTWLEFKRASISSILIDIIVFICIIQAQPVGQTHPETITSVLSSVVTILSVDASGNYSGHGSGFFISADGEIVTNFHVIRGQKLSNLWVMNYNGGYHRVLSIVSSDDSADVAIIKVSARRAVAASLANSDSVKVGQTVFVVGTPAQLEFESTVSKGIVSQLRIDQGRTVLQFDAAVSPGSSGGPIFDEEGKVVGIVRAGVPYTGSGQPVQSINLGIPSAQIRRIRSSSVNNDLRFEGRRGKLNDLLTSLQEAVVPQYNATPTILTAQNPFIGRVLKMVRTRTIAQLGVTRASSELSTEFSSAFLKRDTLTIIKILDQIRIPSTSDTARYVLAASVITSKNRYDLDMLRALTKFYFVPQNSSPDNISRAEFEALWTYEILHADTVLSEDGSMHSKLKNPSLFVWDSIKANILTRLLKSVSESNSPTASNLLNLIAVTCWVNGQYAYADSMIRTAISEDPIEPTYHRNLGVVHFALGEEQRGLAELFTAWQMTHSPEIEFLIALQYLKNGQYEASYRTLTSTSYCEQMRLKLLATGIAATMMGRTADALLVYKQMKEKKYPYAKELFSLMYD